MGLKECWWVPKYCTVKASFVPRITNWVARGTIPWAETWEWPWCPPRSRPPPPTTWGKTPCPSGTHPPEARWWPTSWLHPPGVGRFLLTAGKQERRLKESNPVRTFNGEWDAKSNLRTSKFWISKSWTPNSTMKFLLSCQIKHRTLRSKLWTEWLG